MIPTFTDYVPYEYLVPGDYNTVDTPLPSTVNTKLNKTGFRCRANSITLDDDAPYWFKRQVHRAWVILHKYPEKRYLAELIVRRVGDYLDDYYMSARERV